MIARIRKSMQEKDQGFTLIELLVVMIIIGILAAIAIPVFLNQRKKAEDSAAKADVSTLGKEIATYFVDWDGATAVTAGITAPEREAPGQRRGRRQRVQERRVRQPDRRVGRPGLVRLRHQRQG